MYKGVVINDVTASSARPKQNLNLNNFIFCLLKTPNLLQSIQSDRRPPLLTCCLAAEGLDGSEKPIHRLPSPLLDAAAVTLLLMNDSAALPPALSGAPCPPLSAVRPKPFTRHKPVFENKAKHHLPAATRYCSWAKSLTGGGSPGSSRSTPPPRETQPRRRRRTRRPRHLDLWTLTLCPARVRACARAQALS